MSRVTNSDTHHTEIGKGSGPDSKAICAVSKSLCLRVVLRSILTSQELLLLAMNLHPSSCSLSLRDEVLSDLLCLL